MVQGAGMNRQEPIAVQIPFPPTMPQIFNRPYNTAFFPPSHRPLDGIDQKERTAQVKGYPTASSTSDTVKAVLLRLAEKCAGWRDWFPWRAIRSDRTRIVIA